MNTQAWLGRLGRQLPGWHVWTSSPATDRWQAVPAPAEMPHVEVHALPGRVACKTPQALREACLARYGWNDICDTCGVLARECGHRQPESRTP